MEVVDPDAHFLESLPELSKYMEGPWASRFGAEQSSSGSTLLPGTTGDRRAYGRIQREMVSYPNQMTPEEIPEAMEFLGIDVTIQLSHKMLMTARVKGEDERPAVLANAYIDYMLDRVVDPDEGIYTMVVVPYQDPDASVELIDRVHDERGVIGVCIITPGAEPPLGNRAYDPIYEIAQEKDLPVVLHSGGAGIDEFYLKGYEKFIETHVLGFLLHNQAQATSIVVQGVPEKFPDLDLVFQESGIAWVPALMQRLDTEYLKRSHEAPLLEQLPSDYMEEFYYGTQPLEQPKDPEHLECVIEMMGGIDSLMYTSDWPHWDYDPPGVIEDIPFLSEEEKAQILGGTAKEVFGL